MIIAGIDWSMSSPGIVIGDTNTPDFPDLRIHAFASKKKQVSGLPNLRLDPYPLYSCNEERFNLLAEWAMALIRYYEVEAAYLEGYAYGGSGTVFQIAENTGVLKNKLWANNIPITTFAPSEIKKYATTKGNANKFLMESCFKDKTGIDMVLAVGDKATDTSIPAPVTDIIDAYWIWQLARDSISAR